MLRSVRPEIQSRKVERGTLKVRAARAIVDISLLLIAWIANKSLPSCSAKFLEGWERIGGIVGG